MKAFVFLVLLYRLASAVPRSEWTILNECPRNPDEQEAGQAPRGMLPHPSFGWLMLSCTDPRT